MSLPTVIGDVILTALDNKKEGKSNLEEAKKWVEEKIAEAVKPLQTNQDEHPDVSPENGCPACRKIADNW